jgi:hypothetical protein
MHRGDCWGRGDLPTRYLKATGSLDRRELDAQLPNKLARSRGYLEIGALARRIEVSQDQNQLLKRKLAYLTKSAPNSAVELEKFISNLEIRLSEREADVAKLREHFHETRQPKPTFLEVALERHRRHPFDLVASSLLVSNGQRHFFTAVDLADQNSDLQELLMRQEEELRSLRARVFLHSKRQRDTMQNLTLALLMDGRTPSKLLDAAPTQRDEQLLKTRLLSAELQALVAERKRLIAARRAPVMDARMAKLQHKAAVKIQAVIRGYLSRGVIPNGPPKTNSPESEKT